MSTRVKTWCQDVGLKGNYGNHTLRKTWGCWQRLEGGTASPLLMEAFEPATQQQTLAYLGIQSHELAAIYELELSMMVVSNEQPKGCSFDSRSARTMN